MTNDQCQNKKQTPSDIKNACDDNNTAAPSKLFFELIHYIRNHGIATNYIICNNWAQYS